MKLSIKYVVGFALSFLFVAYSSAATLPLENFRQRRAAIVSGQNLSGKVFQQEQRQPQIKKLPCEQQSGFQDKINRIKTMATNKTQFLDKIDTSLDTIVPLVKNPTIKTRLGRQQQQVQSLIKNYTTLKSTLETHPSSFCGKGPVWKQYNEKTKVVIEDIRGQFRLLKR